MSEDTKKESSLEKSLTTLAWLVNINARDLAKKHEKEDKGRYYKCF
jgi:hypothetical protein